MLTLFLRALILYLVIFVIIRLMGKRQVSDMQPFDLVVTILIANLAQTPIINTGVPLLYGIIPIFCLFLIQEAMAILSRKNERAREFLCGKPSIVISKGVVQEDVLRHLQLTLTDLFALLRGKDIASISNVEYAIIETDGTLSVLPKSNQRPLTPQDMSIAPPADAYPHILVLDGRIREDALLAAGYDSSWLILQLHLLGFENPKDVLFASLDSQGNLIVQGKSQKMSLGLLVSKNVKEA